MATSLQSNQIRVRLGRSKVLIDRPRIVGQPLVVSYGMGTDSTAMLILLRDLGIRPDAILFANTGGEKPGTYDYLEIIQAWCSRNGFPAITVVGLRSKHASLEANCTTNFTLPSLAYGGKGCSMKWKAAPMDRWVNNWVPHALAAHAGLKTIRAIGYDAGPADSKRSRLSEDAAFSYWYPLRDHGITRERCIAMIQAEGLAQPGKSACFFCPATKKAELPVLMRNHPDLVARALLMEARAQTRGSKGSTVGLGRNWSWRAHLQETMPDELAALAETYDIGQDLVPLTTRQQTLWSPIQLAMQNVMDRWQTAVDLARAWCLDLRSACQRITNEVKAGILLADYLIDGGVRVPVFRPR